jgi:cytochrome c1
MIMQRSLFTLVLAGVLLAIAQPASAQTEQVTPPRQKWSFAGPFGRYDEAQLQRGFKIYREVCANCHSMEMLSFRNLADAGGPGFSEAQAEAVAAEYKIKDLDDKGNQIERAGRLADHFPPPFPNELVAKATYGVPPPDMSTLAKARGYQRGFPWFLFDIVMQYQEQGPDYISAYINGYKEPPKDFKLPPNGHYNEYFPGHNTAMPQPLQDGQVKYDDGTPETVAQYGKDVAAFLMWVAEPKLDVRKRIGFQVMVFLLVFAGLMYFTKKKVWSSVH